MSIRSCVSTVTYMMKVTSVLQYECVCVTGLLYRVQMVQLKIRWISNYRCHRLVLYVPDHAASKLQCVCVGRAL